MQLRANSPIFRATPPMSLLFVTAGAVSVTTKLQDGATPEVASMGREGLLGYELLLGARSLTNGYLMLGEGSGVSVPRRHLETLFQEDNEFRMRILELALAQTSVTKQLTACSLTHEADQRLARWLLSTSHHLGSRTVSVTQELISMLLGVRRTTVSLISKRYEREGLTRTRRGVMTILDRDALSARSCECCRTLVALNSSIYGQHQDAWNASHHTDSFPAGPVVHGIPDELQAQR
ncbi:Crp/Fnr family transcriptional regulator [Terriglobus roseus]|uniref:Crp/Fnr family transcriptional regulator n=1 Tax=Terriglobus roseus TaxID=392734 RepID=UPI001BAF3D45|nr:Crp/Fnr family transcriptional regulator [Terriglobus roseus]